MNLEFSKNLLQWLKELGVQEVVVCAGGRNAPLVVALAESSLWTHSHFDERAAGFFALGRIKATGKPVVVCTTSGTAVAEVLPAMMEAHYQNLPLIALTADRPRQHRGRGTPQGVEQVNLFGPYVEGAFDLSVGEVPKFTSLSLRRPVHINVCFDEPLLSKGDSRREPWPLPALKDERPKEIPSISLQNYRSPLILVSEIEKSVRTKIAESLATLNLPVFLESPSGISSDNLLNLCGERWLRESLRAGQFDLVVRLGSVPTTRLWRDLETMDVDVISFSSRPFEGLARETKGVYPLEPFFSFAGKGLYQPDLTLRENWLEERRNHIQKLERLIKKYPESEPGWFRHLQDSIPKSSQVYLGNSLPIRLWDLTWSQVCPWNIISHRGANGIDGQVSGFLAARDPDVHNLGIVGDLTALYDLQGFWAEKSLFAAKTQLVIINNGGGMIFSRMFHREEFLNRHSLNFSSIAQFWNWNYHQPQKPTDWHFGDSPMLVEVKPDSKQTEAFWQEWDQK
ncbi:MAG: 2-succinyl-5-enolpyruvyl-6-hydroxy-3-cyclohexene-1-carboxylic-acid synthase [Bdellovibrionales bacterium]|nr:2-succinyl-5-enolpyruvyl-6-hydroxy-3-cyclohexene-1-carboxylic-acid synthase [Bdellovibrionales bacterium]